MSAPLVLLAAARDLPPGNTWLRPGERAALVRLRAPKRRRDFRLGRFVARRALALLENGDGLEALHRFEVRPAAGGAPMAFCEGAPLEVALSISHSDGWAAAGVQRGRARLGCDLERVDERSPGFIGDHFSRTEQEFVSAGGAAERPLRATLVWSAKEAVMKALGEGLRLAAPAVAVMPTLDPSTPGGWSTFAVSHPAEAAGLRGFWRQLGPLVLTLAGELEEPRLVGSPGLESWS